MQVTVQGDSINGNLIRGECNKRAMPDITRTQDINCGINTDNTAELNSQMANLETNTNHPKLHQCHNVSSSCTTTSSASSVSSSATESVANSVATPTSGQCMSENDCESNMNISHALTQEQSDLVSSTSLKDQHSSVEKTTTDSIIGETRTILKEDGLKDIMITVPVLQRLPKSPGNTNSGSKVKPNNGRGPMKSGNQQMRKRPVLVRKATPIKIETPVKVISEAATQMSRENSFVEEDEESEEEQVSAIGVST